jgi:hypothetical protein
MSHAQLYRLSGLSLLVGAAFSFITSLISSVAFIGNDPTPYAQNPLYTISNLVAAIGAVLILLGLPGMYVSMGERAGLVGLIGMLMIFIVACLFGIFFSMMSAVLIPYISSHAPSVVKGNGPPALFPLFLVGAVLLVIGPILLAIPMIRGLVADRWVGYLFVAVAVTTVISFVVSGPNGSTNVLISLITSLSTFLLFFALGWLGYRMWSGFSLAAGETAGPMSARQVT